MTIVDSNTTSTPKNNNSSKESHKRGFDLDNRIPSQRHQHHRVLPPTPAIVDCEIPLSITPRRKTSGRGQFTVQFVSSSAANTTTNTSSHSRKSPKQRLLNIFSFRPDLNRHEQEASARSHKESLRETALMEDARAATFLVDKDRGDKVNSRDLQWRVKALAIACYQYHHAARHEESKKMKVDDSPRESDMHPGSLNFTRCLLEDVDVMFQTCMAAPEISDAETGAVLAFNTTAKQLSQMNLWRI